MMRVARWAIFAVSLTLCIATLALWVRSYSRSDSIHRWRRDVGGPATYHDTMGVFATRGTIGVGRVRMFLPATQEWPAVNWRFDTNPANAVAWPHRWWILGFGHWNATLPPTPAFRGMEVIGITVPLWFVSLLCAMAPGVAARRMWRGRKRRRRITAKLCVACGYDVRASIERCPECGTAIPARQTMAKTHVAV